MQPLGQDELYSEWCSSTRVGFSGKEELGRESGRSILKTEQGKIQFISTKYLHSREIIWGSITYWNLGEAQNDQLDVKAIHKPLLEFCQNVHSPGVPLGSLSGLSNHTTQMSGFWVKDLEESGMLLHTV